MAVYDDADKVSLNSSKSKPFMGLRRLVEVFRRAIVSLKA